MFNIKNMFGMNAKNTGIVFINWGNNDYETNREIVMECDADKVFDEIFKRLPFRGWVSINNTYVSHDKRIEQGTCVKYSNKMN